MSPITPPQIRVSITGHRPEDISGDDAHEWVVAALITAFAEIGATLVIQGMAAGVDLWSAEAAREAKIPYVAVKPWRGHSPRRGDESLYRAALEGAQEVLSTSEAMGYPGVGVYHRRNEYMVDHADAVLGIWTGKSKGGTAACLRYARKSGKPVYIIDPNTRVAVGWESKPDWVSLPESPEEPQDFLL